jgi:prepilin-type N-terminal cleavage/methylation domain-containing protein
MTAAMTTTQRHSRTSGFTLLEMLIVLFITALLLSAMFSVAGGTITLADDIQKDQRREHRQHAYIDFCQHLLTDLPATTALNLQTTQEGSSYLSALELQNVRSPFDGTPQQVVTLKTISLTGGDMRMILTTQRMPDPQKPGSQPGPVTSVVLFDNVAQCEWRAYDIASNQWTNLWREQLPTLLTMPPQAPPTGAPSTNGTTTPPPLTQMPLSIRSAHPLMLELTLATGIDSPRRWVFWIPPSVLPGR